jgi:site-specific DNA recombinase
VWTEVIRLLEDPGLVQTEIDRRREVARNADPLRKREEDLRREQVRVEKSSERLVTACQEGLVTLSQLRQRMPALQKQTQAVESELQSLKMAAVDETKYLQLAESLAGFRSKLRLRADVLDIGVRQQILRLLVKEVLVGGDTITLRHSIPIPQSRPGSNGSPIPSSGGGGRLPGPSYLLRSGSHLTVACDIYLHYVLVATSEDGNRYLSGDKVTCASAPQGQDRPMEAECAGRRHHRPLRG